MMTQNGDGIEFDESRIERSEDCYNSKNCRCSRDYKAEWTFCWNSNASNGFRKTWEEELIHEINHPDYEKKQARIELFTFMANRYQKLGIK